MAKAPTVTNPRIAKLIELEVAGRIKPEHQQELDTYRARGVAPKSTATTEGERKASAFVTRALGANQSYEGTGVGPRSLIGQKMAETTPNLLNSLPGFVGNSAGRQVADTNQDEFIAASLRQDSGAAIPEDEMDRQRRIYFPMPGDGPEVIAAKQAARGRAIQGLVKSAGNGLDPKLRSEYPAYFDDQTASPPSGPAARMAPDQYDAQVGRMIREGADAKAILKFAQDSGYTITNPESLGPITGGAKYRLDTRDDGPDLGRALSLGVGGVVEGAGDLLGIVANPVNAAINATGLPDAIGIDPLSTDIGATLRSGLGLAIPETDRERTVDAINTVGTSALGGGLLARGVSAGTSLLGGGGPTGGGRSMVKYVADKVGAAPGVDTIGGAAAGAAGEEARQGGYGVGGQVAASALAGVTAGGLATLGQRTTGALGAPIASPAPASSANALAAIAGRQGVELLPQDVGGPMIGRMTQAAAQSTFGSGTVKKGADRLYNSFRDRANALVPNEGRQPVDVGNMIAQRADELNTRDAGRARVTSGAVEDAIGAAPADATAAGQAVQRGATHWMRQTADRASRLYDAVPIAAERPAVMTNTRDALATLTREMGSNPRLSSLFENPRLRAYLGALTPQARDEATGLLDAQGAPISRAVQEGGDLSWQDLTEFRTRVGDMLDEPRLSEKIAPRQLRTLYGALSRDVETTARAEGPQAIRAWRRANDFYDGRQKRIDNTLALVVGARNEKTPNETTAALSNMLREGPMGDAAAFTRIMRTLPDGDAATLRASLVRNQRGGNDFDAATFAKNWGALSERGKSALLPLPGARAMMEDAAERAGAAVRNPLAGKSGERVFLDLEAMANNRGDSARFRRQLNAMSPDEANSVRGLIVHRMGLAEAGAQVAEGDAFSISRFLTRWNTMSRDAKATLFGDAEMRQNMSDLAKLAERVKASERMAGHSNTGAINNVNMTTGGLGGAVVALLAGQPLAASALAAPAAYQRISAEVLTSPRFVRWLAKAPKENGERLGPYVRRLSIIAAREPAIAGELGMLQQQLARFANDNTPHFGRVAASPEERQEK